MDQPCQNRIENKRIARAALAAIVLGLISPAGLPAAESFAGRSPDNQVFQFMSSASFVYAGGTKRTATAYLWVPPKCERLRGVLVAGRNVPEHWLVGYPAIREVCEESGLAILWCCPTFLIDPKQITEERDVGAFLQRILDSLAAKSGYEELAKVPWLPIGESYHLIMVKKVVNAYPERCIAAVQIKNAFLDLQPPGVPVLSAIGTTCEWDQEKVDMLNQWKDLSFYDKHRKRRAATPAWPGSLLIEGGSGHFECTEPMAQYIALYIRAAVRARVAADGGAALRPVNLDEGFVAALPVPGSKGLPPTRYKECPLADRSLPWYFDEQQAKEAIAMASINWNAKTQVPVFADSADKPLPFGWRGIFSPVPYQTGEDGITFQLSTTFLDKIPAGFVHAGTELGHAHDRPTVEWICGHVRPLGNNRFRIALDRTWPDSPTYVRVWHPGDADYRASVQPGDIKITPRKDGRPQKISFDAIPDQVAGAKEIPLHATSDAGLPVRFFVRCGPAEVHGDRLVFTPIPPRSKMPITVTVAAWQWGRTTQPAIQSAQLVERSFQITAK